MKVLVAYYSQTGNTQKMARMIAESIKSGGVDVDCKKVEDVAAAELTGYDGFIFGSPVYYGTMSAQVKRLFDESVQFHGDLDGKVGGAFSSSANIGGGNETTVLDMLNAMLIHGIIIQGDPRGDHYGPVSIGSPDKRVKDECARFGKRFVSLLKKVYK